MRITAIVAALVLLIGSHPAFASPRSADEPQTLSIRIRLRGPTLRVRCRGGDCTVTVARDGAGVAVSVTRTRNGSSFTFAKTVPLPTNVAIETGFGTDSVTVGDISVPGFLRVGTGDGDDLLVVDGTSTAKKASIDTGGGSDTAHLAFGVIGGKFRLATHNGNDKVDVTEGQLLNKAGFNGGPGTDSFVAAGAVAFSGPPVVTAFEE